MGCGRVVAKMRRRARGGNASGAEVEGEFWFGQESAGGKLLRLNMFDSREQAFESASHAA